VNLLYGSGFLLQYHSAGTHIKQKQNVLADEEKGKGPKNFAGNLK
jgi:hypothetical protein